VGTAASRSGNSVTYFANGTYTLTFGCSCGTINQTVTVATATANGGSLNRTNSSVCSGASPLEVTVAGMVSYVSQWEKRIIGQSTWTSISHAGNTLFSSLIDNVNSAEYRALIQGTCGATAYSPVYTVTVQGTIAPPVSTSASSITTTTITANWQSVAGASGYLLDVSSDIGFGSFVSGFNGFSSASSGVVVTGLQTGETYYYRVRSTSTCGPSYSSGTISVMMPPAAPTPAPATNISTTGFQANWNASSGSTSYLLSVSTASGFVLPGYDNLPVNGLNQLVTGLTPGTSYTYVIRGVNASGQSPIAYSASALTLPVAPTANSAHSINSSSFVASWNTVAGATTYQLDVASSADFTTILPTYGSLSVAGTNHTVSGLTPETTYYYRVRAVNGSGSSANSNTITTTTALPPPTAAAATNITGTSFTANWSNVNGASGYRLDVSENGSFTSYVVGYQDAPITTTSTVVSGLTAGIDYYYRLRAINATGVSSNSATISVLTLPLAPTATAPTSVTTSSFIANWNIVSNVSQYQVDVSTTDTFTSFVGVYNSHAVTTNSLLVSGLLPGVNYYYRIRALNASGVSANSLVILALTRPEAPVATAATSINSTSFTANWGAVSSATSYLIDVSTISTFSTYVGSYNGYPVVVGNSIQIAGLTAATTYYFRVRAINSTGSSVVSNTVTVTTLSVSACAGYTFGGPSNACLNSPTSYFIFGGNPSGCSISTVTGTAASFSGSAVTFFAPGTYTVSFNCLCGTINQTVSVQTGTVTAGVLSRTTATFCSGSIPPETTLSNFSSFVSGWQKKTEGQSTWLPIAHAGNTLLSYLIDNSVSAEYRAVVQGTCGAIAYSPVYQVTIEQLPAPVAYQSAVNDATSVLPTWSQTTGEYRLDVSTSPTFANSFFVGSFQDYPFSYNQITVNNLNPSTTYYFRVRAIQGSCVSSNSNVISMTTLPQTPFATPATQITSSSFRANWNSVPNVTGYKLVVARNFSLTDIVQGYDHVTVTQTFLNVTGLTAKTSYYYAVVAINGTLTSKYSNVVLAVNLDQNYVQKIQLYKPGFLNASQVALSTIGERSISTEFYDGLGRLSESVGQQQSPLSFDIVQPHAYDALNRENISYLPYVSGNDGWFKPDFLPKTDLNYATSAHYQFYQNTAKVMADPRPYSETLFEASPLNRPLQEFGVGQNWKDNNKFIQHQYLINVHGTLAGQEQIIAWKVDATGFPIRETAVNAAVSDGYYTSGQLNIKSTKDEQGNEVREYVDKEGRTILKKVQAVSGIAQTNNDTHWAMTYYIYDDFGNLSVVLPPEAVKAITAQ
jgi:hypothetical protein